MKQNLMETAVGALVIAIALGFFIFMYSTTGVGKGSGGYHLTAKFKNVEGINIGSDVRMSGIKIGSVTNQALDNNTFDAILTFAIDPTIKLPDDSTAKISSEGLLGGKFIALEPGGNETILADGGTITYTQGALDIWSLVSDYMFSGKKGSESGGGSSGQDGGQSQQQQQQPAPQSEQQPAEPQQQPPAEQQSAPAEQQAPPSGAQDGNASYPAPSIEPYPAPSNQGQSQSGQ
ncbi:MAG TPA: outer membrane lipid asymmetry maintenance protein MlaD [Aestuariivirgaceae bacterium]|jgi:phospholipid/cholesterol/gamma-HCH transport system substrate-binding protein|nr:outer membrane lipid asymmetry maintenance protein MlaD [Aestuariivirgaceae bacterium]